MKELAVFSGKGGTGKTTLLACFARLAARSGPVVAVDCDVDAANLGLLLHGEDRPPVPFLGASKARIHPERCQGCGACAEACRFDAVSAEGSGYRVDPLACEGCRVCARVCPVAGAITFEPHPCGQWWTRRLPEGWLVHAALGVAEDNSGRLVAKLREEARSLAEAHGAGLVLLDGPPGIGCPVHAAMGRVDQVVAVAEPTPSGAHDLLRLLDLARHFAVPAAVAVNRWDLSPAGTVRIEDLARERDVPVLGRVPFDRGVPEALARGRLPLQAPARPDTVAAVESLWAAVQDLLR